MKKILLTGSNGFLGQHLAVFLREAGHTIVATGKGKSRLPPSWKGEYLEADLTNKKDVEELLLKVSPDIIIHNAALSKPDECELNRENCLKANVSSTEYLIQSYVEHFIYLSTDFVFGENGPHAEGDKTNPLNFYGESKLQAEQLVKNSVKNTIVRPVFIYGKCWEGMRGSFVQWVKTALEQRKPIKVVSDQLRTPTYAGDICKGIEKIIEKGAAGVFHLAGKEVLSPYEMAIKTAEVLKLDTSLIEKVTADTFPEPVRRAKKSGLKIDKAVRELRYDPVSFEEGIRLAFDL